MMLWQKTKNIIGGQKIRWRVLLFLGLTLSAVFLLAPLSSQAAWYDYLTPTGLASGFVGLILKLVLSITGLILKFANWFLSWAMGNPYNISYTRPGLQPTDNFVIEIGWTLLRDLINMAFILGLAYIGLSTALDFGNKFETKKTFLNLLLIALLINFTPAICGAVVDVGNILGNFFIQGADFTSLSAIFNRQQAAILRDWSNIITDGTLMFSTLMLIAFGLVAALVLGIYGVLFLARAPIIWLLVILSPAAFFCYIFTATKKQFSQWWELFLQWALILPVTLGFFLYLSMQIMTRTNDLMSISGNDISNLLNRLLPYAIPVAFLIAGLFLTMSKLMGGGAKGILNLAKGAALGVAGGVGATALLAGKKGVAGVRNQWQKKAETSLKPGQEGYEDWQQQHKVRAKAGEIGRFVFGGANAAEKAKWGKAGVAGSYATRGIVGAVTLGSTVWARPAFKRISSKVGGAIDEEQDKKFDKRVADLKDKPVTTLNAALENALPGIVGRQERLAAAKAIIDSKKPLAAFTALTPDMKKQLIKDAINNGKPDIINHFKPLDPMATAEVVNSMNLSESFRKTNGLDVSEEDKKKYSDYKYMDERKVKAGLPEIAEDMEKEGFKKPEQYKEYEEKLEKLKGDLTKASSDEDRAAIQEKLKAIDGLKTEVPALAAKIMAGARFSQMESFSMDTVKIAASSGLINDFWNGPLVGEAGRLLGSEAVKTIQKNLKSKEYYIEHNEQLGRYIGSQTGQALGLDFRQEMPSTAGTQGGADTQRLRKKQEELQDKKSILEKEQDLKKRDQIKREIENLEKQVADLNGAKE